MSAQELRRAEWDFSQIPERELHACVRYEYAREIEDYIAYFEVSPQTQKERTKWNKKNPVPEFFLEEDYKFLEVMFNDPHDFNFGDIPHEYPTCSWQDIPQKMRDKIVWLLDAKSSGIINADSPFFLPHEEAAWNAAFGKQIHRLSIDWRQSDAALLYNFRDWLETNRPKSSRAKVQRGRQSFCDNINALSALRLRHHYTAYDASAITAKVLGKPLYAQAFGWERAAGNALEAFKQFFPKAKGPVSRKLVDNPRGRPRSMKDAYIDALNKSL